MNADVVIDDEVSYGADAPAAPSSPLAQDIENARQKIKDKREALRLEYSQILARHLSKQSGDGERLVQLSGELGTDLDADQKVIQTADELQKSVGTIPEKNAKIAKLKPEIYNLERERDRIYAEFMAKINPLNQRREMLEAEVRGLAHAEKQLATLRENNWRIFGLPDPQIAAKTRVVFQEIFCESGDASIECLLRTPKFNWNPSDSRFTFKGTAHAMEIARQVVNAQSQHFYIVSQSQVDANELRQSDRLVVVDRPARLYGGPLDIDTAFVRLHFQSPEQFDELKKQFMARVKKEKKQIETKGYIH